MACWRLAHQPPVKAFGTGGAKALHHGTWRLRDLRVRCWHKPRPVTATGLFETHPLIRNLDTYRDLCVPDCFAPATSTPNPT